ncbi:MAG: PAS domain-containing sensor histidine kinase, partial [Armatimonadetes bacterium]|nr:PAS domain-containing sensor histidine kinase [Armatimonadota bacterium]
EEVVDRFLNNIISESDRLAALLSDLMEIAKREAGITQLKPSAVNISKALERAYSTLAPMAAQNEINVSFDVPLDMLAVVDELQFIHLVRNLIDNAIKYTPAGGQVDVTAKRLDEGGLSISVRDTGIGIPQGELERIFDRFYRVDKARSRKMGGTGLGLAIVKDIVQAHGGKLYVDTQLGKGSTFTVVLPEGEDG